MNIHKHQNQTHSFTYSFIVFRAEKSVILTVEASVLSASCLSSLVVIRNLAIRYGSLRSHVWAAKQFHV